MKTGSGPSTFVASKGKVTPGEFRAYGYSAPSHRMGEPEVEVA